MYTNALLDLGSELLREVMRFDAPSDGVVSAFFRKNRNLGHRDRGVLAETVYAVLRQRLLFQNLAQSGRGPIERRLAVLAWRGEEALLRRTLAPGEDEWRQHALQIDLGSPPERLRHNLPDWLVEPLMASVGDDFWPLVASLNTAAPLDLRVNAMRVKRDDVLNALRDAGLEAAATPHSPWGLRLQGKPALNKLALFEQGDIEVQDEGSQLLALLTEAKRGEMVVDFCAGAGGKTLALGAMMRNTGRLYAFDVSGHRLDALKPRLARSGLSNVFPAQIAHERDDRVKRLGGKIDRVLVDAPCSGLGTLRRNPDLKWRQSAVAIEELRVKQAAILASAARQQKPGGQLVYATCSLLESENDAVAQDFTRAQPDFKPVPVADVLERNKVAGPLSLTRGPFLRLWPHRHATDGFFAAVWQRR